ncbi:hypothetical protein [Calycomorphotria hydatis]|nr:hypothetical protein [Calycomorphotria hydatis]
MAKELGRALADAGHKILVYSSNPDFVESAVVDGYCESGNSQEGGIERLFPAIYEERWHGAFSQEQDEELKKLFVTNHDSRSDWRISYYQSLNRVGGMIAIGGGQATFNLGLMSMAYPVPIVSLGAFGGASEKLLEMVSQKRWILDEDIDLMREANDAGALVESLERQQETILSDQAALTGEALQKRIIKLRSRRSGVALASLLFSIVLLTFLLYANGLPSTGISFGLSLFAFMFLPIAIGVSGANIYAVRSIRESDYFDENGKQRNRMQQALTEAIAFGATVGLISFLVFLSSQITANEDIGNLKDLLLPNYVAANSNEGLEVSEPAALTRNPADNKLPYLLFFAVPICFIAGLTYETVYARWEKVEPQVPLPTRYGE